MIFFDIQQSIHDWYLNKNPKDVLIISNMAEMDPLNLNEMDIVIHFDYPARSKLQFADR